MSLIALQVDLGLFDHKHKSLGDSLLVFSAWPVRFLEPCCAG